MDEYTYTGVSRTSNHGAQGPYDNIKGYIVRKNDVPVAEYRNAAHASMHCALARNGLDPRDSGICLPNMLPVGTL